MARGQAALGPRPGAEAARAPDFCWQAGGTVPLTEQTRGSLPQGAFLGPWPPTHPPTLVGGVGALTSLPGSTG